MSDRPPLHRILADLFPGRERGYLAGVFVASVVTALFETLGVASILPFMALVLDPAAIGRYAVLQDAAAALGIGTPEGLLMFVGIATVVVVLLGNLVAAANIYVQQRFAARCESRFAASLFAGYMRQPYTFHVQRDTASLLKVLNADGRAVLDGFVTPLLLGASRLLMVAGVLALLLVRDPIVALSVGAVFLVAYAVIFRVVHLANKRIGVTFNRATEEATRLSQEGLGGIKELMVLGREATVVDLYSRRVRSVSYARAMNAVVGQLPKYLIEPLAFGGILLTTLVLVTRSDAGTQTVVPVLALYAFAGYRLLPAFQQIFASVVLLRFYEPSLRNLHRDFVQVAHPAARLPQGQSAGVDIGLHDVLRLDHVTFTHGGAAAPALRDVSLAFRPGESVGLVGRSGAGKTTLADIVLGLFQPDSGVVSVDGQALSGPIVHAWRQRVGYVPQSVFLANASVADNIAFGVAAVDVDRAAVREAAERAHVDDFVRSLPHGYDTIIGERGVKLSGGQRQRIGIARALYHGPDVLVFDEATSALDGLTEDSVTEAIRSLRGHRLVILIAHRLRTVEACDRIVMLEQGTVVADGPYQALFETNRAFGDLVRGSDQPSARAEEIVPG